MDHSDVKQRKPTQRDFSLDTSLLTTGIQVPQTISNLTTNEINDFEYKNDKKEFDHKQQQTATQTGLSLENAAWFTASILSIYFSDIFNVIIYDERVYR